MSEPQIVLHLTDQHFPDHDPYAIRTSIEAVSLVKPDVLVLGGDLIDAYAFSRFEKKTAKLAKFQKEIDLADDYLGRLHEASPDSETVWMYGNHEDRIERYLHRQAPALADMAKVSLQEWLSTNARNISVYDYGETYDHLSPLVFAHGTVIRKKAGMSAASMVDMEGRSIAMGHSHRLGMSLRRMGPRVLHAYESGCLCKLRQEYTKHTPDWQLGFSMFLIDNGQIQWLPVHLTKNSKHTKMQLRLLTTIADTARG